LKPSSAEWLIARDSALLQLLPTALVANYYKIEVTRENAWVVYADARRSRLKLNALLDVYAGQSLLNSSDALAIRLALSEYAQYLGDLKRLLQHVAISIRLRWTTKLLSTEKHQTTCRWNRGDNRPPVFGEIVSGIWVDSLEPDARGG
jgi:hypothetical protein